MSRESDGRRLLEALRARPDQTHMELRREFGWTKRYTAEVMHDLLAAEEIWASNASTPRRFRVARSPAAKVPPPPSQRHAPAPPSSPPTWQGPTRTVSPSVAVRAEPPTRAPVAELSPQNRRVHVPGTWTLPTGWKQAFPVDPGDSLRSLLPQRFRGAGWS